MVDAATIRGILEDRGRDCGRVVRGASALDEAAQSMSFWDYLIGAQEEFLRAAARLIKREAGGHAESVTVKRGRSVAWLEYKGQDRSDMDLEWTVSLIVKEPDVDVHVDADSVSGRSKRDVSYKIGVLTPDDILRLFQNSFGL